MGKSPEAKRLTIVVAEQWTKRPEILELMAKGHTLIAMQDLVTVDLILHPSAHWWTEEFWDTNMLEAAVKKARERKAKRETKK